MLFRRFIALGALVLLLAPASFAQETKPAVPAEKPSAVPVKPKATPTPAEPSITFNSVHVDGSFIALTFDDGPNATLTPKLLDLLAARHLKATFFVVGQNAADHPEILKRAVREGHEIANHSWSHPYLGKMSDDAVRRELQKTEDAIVAAIGKKPTLMRPAVRIDYGPSEKVDPRRVRLSHHPVGRRSARLEAARTER